MDFAELAEKRYSCRKMSSSKVDDRLIDRIIETASKAPTAVNRQPVKIFRFKSEEAKNAVRQVCGHTFGADCFLAVGYREEDGWVREFDSRPFADVDAAIVACHIMLAAADLGLATTWVGHFDAPALRRKFKAMKDYELIALFPIGYAAEDAKPSSMHFGRRSPEELTEVL